MDAAALHPPAAATPNGTPGGRPPAPLTLARLLEIVAAPGLDPDDLDQRDPAFIRAVMPYFDALTSAYFRPEYQGFEHVPTRGPFIAVGNHNGGPMLPDLWTLLVAWEKRFGADFPMYCLVHDVAFNVRPAGNFFLKLGGVRAGWETARKVLERGAGLLVYPGGELDCFRSFWQRNTVDLQGRTGFVRLALTYGAPIVPIVNVGAHETLVTLFSSPRLARWTGLEWLTRVKTLPVSLGLPWGIWATGFMPFLPLPAKFAYRIGKPIAVPHAPERARDEATVRRIYRRVTRTMQDMVDDLASRRRLPILG